MARARLTTRLEWTAPGLWFGGPESGAGGGAFDHSGRPADAGGRLGPADQELVSPSHIGQWTNPKAGKRTGSGPS